MAGRRAVSVVVLCLAWAGAAFGEPQPSREDFVRALMQRSRIVDDVRFQLPVEIYRLYLIEQAARPQPAPVAYIIERGLYGVTLDANSQPIMRVELSIRVLDPPRCREIPILSTALAWDGITVNGRSIKVLSQKDPAALPWKDLGVDIVLESTGLFTDRDKAAKHLEAASAGA